jgi:phosphoribosylformimino-5-aminoimidazole carboxamide ribotide isomerase
LQVGKRNVGLIKLEAAGNYGLRLTFDDGHDSGIFTWDYLYQLAIEQDSLMALYEQRIHEAGKSRDEGVQVINLLDPKQAP